MIQFYFLSVAINIACGLALILPNRPQTRQFLQQLETIFSDVGLRIALGSLGIVTGILTLISPIQGDVPFVGDLIPSLTAALAGLVLLLELRSERQTETEPVEKDSPAEETPPFALAIPLSHERLRSLLIGSGRVIGLIAVFAGIIHFLFPLELFL